MCIYYTDISISIEYISIYLYIYLYTYIYDFFIHQFIFAQMDTSLHIDT